MLDNIEQEILAHEQDLTQATQRLAIDAIDRISSNDILFTGATGAICNKSSFMDEMRRGAEERQNAPEGSTVTYEREDLHAVTHGDTAVTSYRFTVSFRSPGRDAIINRFRTTNVWMRQPGWQVVAAHTNKLE